jgi:orotate phosphoribosyltransferase
MERSSRWVAEYKKRDALWIHDGNPKRPHALLTSGKHSSGFFNSGLVTEDPCLIMAACADLVGAVAEEINLFPLTHVIGSALGAIVMSHCMALSIQGIKLGPCLSSFTEKVDSDGAIRMVLKRSTLGQGAEILVVEDVLTTGGSLEHTIEAVTQAGGHAAPVIAVLVNRSGLKTVRGGRKVISLIDEHMPIWESKACPLCAQGSEAIRPKDAANWARLSFDYPV